MEPSSDFVRSAEEAERLKLFVANVKDYAIFMLSPEGMVTSWNAGAERFKGYSAEEIIGQHFSRFYTEEDRAIDFPSTALRTAVDTGKFEHEGWRVRKDGTKFWASVVIDPIRDSEGALVGFAKVTRDITEQKKAAEALHASEEQFRILVQGVTDYAIYMLSPTGIITSWNAGAQRIKGFEKEEVVGTHFSRFYTEQDAERGLPNEALEKAAAKGCFENEGWRVRKDGSRFWAHVVIDPIRNQLGELIGFAKVTRDITERRESAEALEKTREALFQAQKLEAIGKLTGGVAHDFNNLLSVISNGLEILRMVVNTESGLRVLDSMERATDRGAKLTEQLLSFARQQPLQQEAHDINSVIRSFSTVLRRANTSKVQFVLDLAPSLPPVLIDATQFETGLLNLVVNSGDAMPGGGAITVSTRVLTLAENEVSELPPGDYVKVGVADTGEGIPPEALARVVEPFFTTKPIGKGTGLGLSQVYGFVQQMNGELVIDSQLGVGTTVSIYLPCIKNGTGETTDHESSESTVLVVDDQPDVREMAVELFRTLGYRVLAAESGDEALALVDMNADIEVLFTDVVMPGMNGVELGKRVREALPKAHIILVSGYANPDLEDEARKVHQFDFLSKPYRLSEIVKKLRGDVAARA